MLYCILAQVSKKSKCYQKSPLHFPVAGSYLTLDVYVVRIFPQSNFYQNKRMYTMQFWISLCKSIMGKQSPTKGQKSEESDTNPVRTPNGRPNRYGSISVRPNWELRMGSVGRRGSPPLFHPYAPAPSRLPFDPLFHSPFFRPPIPLPPLPSLIPLGDFRKYLKCLKYLLLSWITKLWVSQLHLFIIRKSSIGRQFVWDDPWNLTENPIK